MRVIFFRIICFLIFQFSLQDVIAQVEEEDAKQNREWSAISSLKEDRADWVPTLLTAASLPIYTLSQFNGYVFSWIPRGQASNSSSYIDGINWQSKIGAWDALNTYSGLYKAFHAIDIASNFEYSKLGFGDHGSVHYLTANTQYLKKSLTVASRFSNSTFIYEGTMQLNSGPIKRQRWSYQLNIAFQYAPAGTIPNGFKNLTGVAYTADKHFKSNQSMGLTIWWDQVAQGKISPAVKEVFDLSAQRNYNPNWGWYNGKPFYASQKTGDVPVAYFRYEKKWGDRMAFQLQIGLAFGTQKKSQMDWAKTLDPRPDYYKYLPSYAKDSMLQIQLKNWFTSNPQALQINFDQLQNINQSSATHQSFYIINAQIAKVNLQRLSLRWQYQFPMDWSGQMGLHVAKDVIRNYNRIEDLLGGAYFLNYNSWVDDNGSANNFQNEIRQPNQKIKAGQVWGSDFSMQNTHLQSWTQISKQTAHYEFSLALQLENNRFNRIGYNQNGLFPNISLGNSSVLSFPAEGIKAHFLYKFSGRIYARSILFYQSIAPNASSIYLDPSLHPFTASFILPEIHKGVDFTLFYRGVYSKINASIFWQTNQNLTEKRLFYHDQYQAFVYGMLGQMQTIHKGFELGMETQFSGPLQLSAVSSFGHYAIVNNPLFEIRLVNDLYKVASGSLQLKGLPAYAHPQAVQAFSIQYQPSYSTRVAIAGVYSMKRSIEYNFFRRSYLLKTKINDASKWELIQAENYLPDQWVFNAYMSKQFLIGGKNKKQQIRFSASIRNILNTLIPIFSFEQARFDYTGLRLDKFPLKYMYDQGTTYALGVQMQIQ